MALSSRQDLAKWLGLTDRELRYVLYALSSDKKYTTFTIKKRTGADRVIEAPHPALKNLQRKLLTAISEIAPASGLAKGYVLGRSTIDHAWLHRRKRFVILADLKEFFPTITFRRVRGALLAKPFQLPSAVATCVAQLCCKDGVLPQGAPTSPVLSNLICRSLDHKLLQLAKKHRLAVSRYVDDICFSTSRPTIPGNIAVPHGAEWEAGPELTEAIRVSGFELNHSKFKVRSRETTQLVTGLVVNHGVSLPRRWRRQLRVLLHLVKKHGEKKAGEIAASWVRPTASRRGFASIEQVIRGKSHFAQYVDRRCNRAYSDALFRSYPGQRRLLPRPLRGVQLRLMAEGKTDLLHLEAAHRAFNTAGEYAHIRPRFVNFPSDTGDVELLKTLNRIAKSDIPELTIGVFDCDNPKFMKDAGLQPAGYVQLGSNVFCMCLAPPPSLAGVPFCIELLYERDELCAMTTDARRVFLPDEFDQATGLSHDGLYRRTNPKKSALVVSDQVVRVSDGYSSLLGKADLATLVSQQVPPFEEMNFGGFQPTFDLIGSIIDMVHGR
ncbi:reverse transcriptase family protein [Lysobacter sp. M15]|uniref:reverse transcriptase family protein n=1 Tax=Lysobacter sp. M15 TaxID=2916837 RepID=UPI001F5A0BB2|nr:reverse transcriptase family protein [Lysobacter sp. M15]